MVNGRDLRLGRLGQDKALKPITEPQQKSYAAAARVQPLHLQPHRRIQSFKEIVASLPEDMVVRESSRCLMCGASCVQSCPYDVMQFNDQTLKAVKCDLCVEKRASGEFPACTTVCPTRCIYWGDPETFPNGSRKDL